MATLVVMPQMGESIAEGTIVRWIKRVGEAVDRDEPLFEISTDKVDAEIPSPAAGVLTEIKVRAGESVAVNSVVATIQPAGELAAPSEASASTPQPDTSFRPEGHDDLAAPPTNGQDWLTSHASQPQKSSPVVRRIAREHNLDITRIAGSGIRGRVTKQDVLEYLGRVAESSLHTVQGSSGPTEPGAPPSPDAPSVHSTESFTQGLAADMPTHRVGDRADVQPLSVMRKKIAEHMVLSRRTSAHVHSVFHVNFSAVERIRRQKKAEYEWLGTRLTYMAFIAKAVADGLRHHPIVNASIDGDNVIYKKDVNIGIAVALDAGLIVPVIRNADQRSLLGLSRAIADIAQRARTKQLQPADVQGGTFTITNPGQFGAQFGMPIINQPQVAILGIGTIEQRPIVTDDAIAIRTMAYMTLGYDHRLIDGAVADQFMADVTHQIENFDPSQA